jgi:hypothetical protein
MTAWFNYSACNLHDGKISRLLCLAALREHVPRGGCLGPDFLRLGSATFTSKPLDSSSQIRFRIENNHHRAASLPPRDRVSECSDARSEEEAKVPAIGLSQKAAKLMTLCDIEGFKNIEDILISGLFDTVCPAICMTEGCDHTAELEPDQREGYCEVCGGNTMVSALVLAGVI